MYARQIILADMRCRREAEVLKMPTAGGAGRGPAAIIGRGARMTISISAKSSLQASIVACRPRTSASFRRQVPEAVGRRHPSVEADPGWLFLLLFAANLPQTASPLPTRPPASRCHLGANLDYHVIMAILPLPRRGPLVQRALPLCDHGVWSDPCPMPPSRRKRPLPHLRLRTFADPSKVVRTLSSVRRVPQAGPIV